MRPHVRSAWRRGAFNAAAVRGVCRTNNKQRNNNVNNNNGTKQPTTTTVMQPITT